MTKSPSKLLETSALVIGYAMSRLDRRYLAENGLATWNEAFRRAGEALGVAPASIKNLRDEFDPVHGNARKGWADRPMYPSRQRVMGQLCDVSDAALLEIVRRVLAQDADANDELVAPLSQPVGHVANVAERLRTGRLAESFFLEHSERIASIRPADILDHRELARGYDFGVRDRDGIAIEIKGIKAKRGGILFTDREWTEARYRGEDYWLVVVGAIEKNPVARLVRDPASTLEVEFRSQTSIAATWHSTIAVA